MNEPKPYTQKVCNILASLDAFCLFGKQAVFSGRYGAGLVDRAGIITKLQHWPVMCPKTQQFPALFSLSLKE